MEKKEFDTEWAAMDLPEKLNVFGAASEFGGRIIFGVVNSVDKQKWTAQLDSLLGDWVWSLFERYDATHEEKVYDIYDGYHSIQEMIADSSDDPAVQEHFVRLIVYLMDHAGSAEDHCLGSRRAATDGILLHRLSERRPATDRDDGLHLVSDYPAE